MLLPPCENNNFQVCKSVHTWDFIQYLPFFLHSYHTDKTTEDFPVTQLKISLDTLVVQPKKILA